MAKRGQLSRREIGTWLSRLRGNLKFQLDRGLVAGARMTAGAAKEWRRGGVAAWRNDRGRLARRVSPGRCFS